MRLHLNPLTVKKIRRFRSMRRGYWSFWIFCLMILASLAAELLVNDRAVLVCYQGRLYCPTYGDPLPGRTFGLDYDYETDYRDLSRRLAAAGAADWVLMPPVPYGPYSTDLRDDAFPPFAPSWREGHYLGTDTVGRDVLARLVYGFRIAIFFSLGYFGGRCDLFFQRVIEIWANVPFLYVVIIVSSIVVPSFTMLILIMAFFGWIGITWTMRTVTYKERTRDYVLAARVLGASHARIVFRHILPNTVAVIVTYAPFSVSSGIVALTSLDYLGFGLPPPTPSWGELLQQGWAYMSAWWILAAVVGAMVLTLVAVTFIGEAVREAFDPKRYTVYE